MPTYNYLCNTCDHLQEEFRFVSERTDDASCVKCGSVSKQTVSTPIILYDGSEPDNIAAHDRWVKHHEQKGNGVRTL
jgi:putative FmdB family regulatory protein|tara:strand:- start:1600 stop:1830 length:231 start_codon:yes stop_codon:yes gene_type:complete